MINVLIVDDSKVARETLIHMFSSDPEINVIGTAHTGSEAVMTAIDLRPDLITMDIHMPGMNGYEATKIIMEKVPTPIVIVSSSLGIKDVANSFKALEAGALSVAFRPHAVTDPEYEAERDALIRTIKLMSEVKVVKRFHRQSGVHPRGPALKKEAPVSAGNKGLIAIGASTGGPVVLQTLLSNFPEDLPVPVVIVQHIAPGFMKGFMNWLALSSRLPIEIAEEGLMLKPRTAYIAPDNCETGITGDLKFSMKKRSCETGSCPSVDYLFNSVAERIGANAIGILLTGMGKDGAASLKKMKERGAITIAQNQESCVVYGMPGEAVKTGAAGYVLPPLKIAEFISDIFRHKKFHDHYRPG